MKKIVITGGHLTPALAVISELKKIGDWDIYYFGRNTSMEGDKTPSVESKIIPEKGIKFISFNTGRLQRKFSKYTIPSLLRIPWGLMNAFSLLIKIRPSAVCSFGGYVSVPVVISAWFLRIPILTHEQTVVFGLASKINSYFATKIAVSFPQSLNHFKNKKVILTGNPIREEIFISKKPSWIEKITKPIIYITGGSQGSVAINNTIKKITPNLLKNYILIHQVGEKSFNEFEQFKNNLNEDQKENYFVLNYINAEEIGWVMEKSDLIISRAGANTICEIAALGKIAIFIPLPYSFKDEQLKNAQILSEIGIAEIIPQENLTSQNLEELIDKIMKNKNEYLKNSNKSKELVNLSAAENITREIEKIAN